MNNPWRTGIQMKNVLCFIKECIYIGQIAKRPVSTRPVLIFNMQNTTKHSTWSGRVFGHARVLLVESKHRNWMSHIHFMLQIQAQYSCTYFVEYMHLVCFTMIANVNVLQLQNMVYLHLMWIYYHEYSNETKVNASYFQTNLQAQYNL